MSGIKLKNPVSNVVPKYIPLLSPTQQIREHCCPEDRACLLSMSMGFSEPHRLEFCRETDNICLGTEINCIKTNKQGNVYLTLSLFRELLSRKLLPDLFRTKYNNEDSFLISVPSKNSSVVTEDFHKSCSQNHHFLPFFSRGDK